MDVRSLLNLSQTSKWFNRVMERTWRSVCFRDLLIPEMPQVVAFPWSKLYKTAFDGSHSYSIHQQDNHIFNRRIGAFFFESPNTFVTARPIDPPISQQEGAIETMLQLTGTCYLGNIKTGIWIADFHVVWCNDCIYNCDNTCAGKMLVLDARHIELFSSEGYVNGIWQYDVLGRHPTNEDAFPAAGIFDHQHFGDDSTSDLINVLKERVQNPEGLDIVAYCSAHAVAFCSSVLTQGQSITFHGMRDGADGKFVSIRITEKLQRQRFPGRRRHFRGPH